MFLLMLESLKKLWKNDNFFTKKPPKLFFEKKKKKNIKQMKK
jgi:hypothetical protein